MSGLLLLEGLGIDLLLWKWEKIRRICGVRIISWKIVWCVVERIRRRRRLRRMREILLIILIVYIFKNKLAFLKILNVVL